MYRLEKKQNSYRRIVQVGFFEQERCSPRHVSEINEINCIMCCTKDLDTYFMEGKLRWLCL